MPEAYVVEVSRFGGSKPYVDGDGNKRNCRHETDFESSEVVTDGRGNVTCMPLLVKKPYFGRPERFYRASVGSTPWSDDNGERRLGDTPCVTCARKSPGVYEACFNLCEERVASDPAIKSALDEWVKAVGVTLGRRAFHGRLSALWQGFLDAITQCGGWTNVNDAQLRIYVQAKADADRKARAASGKARRRAARAARHGKARPITTEFLVALDAERDRRADDLKSLTKLPIARTRSMRWLGAMSDQVCDRVADVWRQRELGKYAGSPFTQKEIAQHLLQDTQRYGSFTEATMRARVCEDKNKRLARLEDDRGGPPIWPAWSYDADP